MSVPSHPSPKATSLVTTVQSGVDYLAPGIGTRDYFRVSERGACDFVIGARIVGLPEQIKSGSWTPRGTPMPLRMGSALEPQINDFLTDQGLQLHFTGYEQLEVAHQDPYTMGHPDGLITLDSLSQLSEWARFNLPKFAQELLADGEMLLSEIKTMNDESWTAFVKGGLKSHPFLVKYLDQIHGYLGVFDDPSNDELWSDYSRVNPLTGEREFILGSKSFRRLLQARGCDRPSYCLVTGFNTATKQYAFEVIRFDPVFFANRSDEMEKVAQYLHIGELPPPSFDGHAQSCYFCPFTHICPAVLKIKTAEGFDLLDLTAPDMGDREDLGELDNLAVEYVSLRTDIKAMSRRAKELRELFRDRTISGQKIVTDSHRIKKVSVSGRKSIDADALEELADSLGFEIPYKQGSGYERLYIEPIYGPTFKDDDRD